MKKSSTVSPLESHIHVALAMVILDYLQRVNAATSEILEFKRQISVLQEQQNRLQEQKENDSDYLRHSLQQLDPSMALIESHEGRVELPSSMQEELEQLQLEQTQLLLPPSAGGRIGQHTNGQNPDTQGETTPKRRKMSERSRVGEKPPAVTDIDLDAKMVIEDVLTSEPEERRDWKTTVQRALDFESAPQSKNHEVFRALKKTYRLLETLHEGGTVSQPTEALMAFYQEHFQDEEKWNTYKSVMLSWEVVKPSPKGEHH